MKNKLPVFKSAEDEAVFWDTHSVTDYIGELETVDELFVLSPTLEKKIRERAKRRLVSLRLAHWEIEKSKQIAKIRKIPYQTLLRQWIDEGLRAAFTKHRSA